MPVKLRLEIRSRINNRVLTVKALANTGFTGESPDLAIPLQLAKELGLQPPLQNTIVVSLEIGGGEVEAYIVPQALIVKVVTEDRSSKEVIANALVNPYINEAIISDYLAEELGIQILYPRRGIWKFVDEEKLRYSV